MQVTPLNDNLFGKSIATAIVLQTKAVGFPERSGYCSLPEFLRSVKDKCVSFSESIHPLKILLLRGEAGQIDPLGVANSHLPGCSLTTRADEIKSGGRIESVIV
jgi:hypothetical protein